MSLIIAFISGGLVAIFGQLILDLSIKFFEISKENALSMLSNDAAEIITQVYGDIDLYLDTLIEATVKQLKK